MTKTTTKARAKAKPGAKTKPRAGTKPGSRGTRRTPATPLPPESAGVACAPGSAPASFIDAPPLPPAPPSSLAPPLPPAPPAAAVDATPVPQAADSEPAPVPSAAVCQPATLLMDSSVQIKDVEAVHGRFVAALAGASSLAVDVGGIESIDTAGVQLLLAVQKGAAARGVPLEFRGQSPALSQALATLGLGAAFAFVIPHG